MRFFHIAHTCFIVIVCAQARYPGWVGLRVRPAPPKRPSKRPHTAAAPAEHAPTSYCRTYIGIGNAARRTRITHAAAPVGLEAAATVEARLLRPPRAVVFRF